MSITLRPPVRPESTSADLDQATSTFALVVLAAVAPALLVRMLATIGEAAASTPGARPMWTAVAAVVQVLGLGGLGVLGLTCAAAAVAAVRSTRVPSASSDPRVAALYAASAVSAAVGVALLV